MAKHAWYYYTIPILDGRPRCHETIRLAFQMLAMEPRPTPWSFPKGDPLPSCEDDEDGQSTTQLPTFVITNNPYNTLPYLACENFQRLLFSTLSLLLLLSSSKKTAFAKHEAIVEASGYRPWPWQ